MNKKLTFRQLTLIGSMLFGLFFGAGNLIFPLILGAKAGQNLSAALLGCRHPTFGSHVHRSYPE